MFPKEIKDKFRRLMELREAKDTAEAAAKAAKAEYQSYELELHDQMTEDGTLSTKEASIKIPLGAPWGTVTFQPKATTYSRVLDKGEVEDFFTAKGVLPEFSEVTLSAARLNELVREREEAGESLPEGIDSYKRRFVSITRQK